MSLRDARGLQHLAICLVFAPALMIGCGEDRRTRDVQDPDQDQSSTSSPDPIRRRKIYEKTPEELDAAAKDYIDELSKLMLDRIRCEEEANKLEGAERDAALKACGETYDKAAKKALDRMEERTGAAEVFNADER